jgi:hypothetical protein
MGMEPVSTLSAVAPTVVADCADNEALQNFGRHCQSFYNSSLVITNSSSSLDQDKNVGYAKSNEHKVAQGKVVMETLDRIVAMRAASVEGSRESLEELRREHALVAEIDLDLLQDCGLLNVDRFLEPSVLDQEKAAVGYEQYIQMRDMIRRRSHKFAIVQRQSSLFELLSESDHSISIESSAAGNNASQLTQLENMKKAITTTQQFVKKYRSNIGSHSFLAGLYKFIHLQLHPTHKSTKTDPFYIVQWNFLGSVLTEACHSNDDGDSQAYAREAVKLLFSFLTWVKSDDIEEGFCSIPDDNFDLAKHTHYEKDLMLSFQVNKHVSNANLHRILAVLPNPKDLDARGTGSVEVVDAQTVGENKNVLARVNVDGLLDEQWGWFAGWQLCNVL